MKLRRIIGIYLLSILFLAICVILSLVGSKNIEFSQVINALNNSSDTSFAH